jgi:hypothetical protein
MTDASRIEAAMAARDRLDRAMAEGDLATMETTFAPDLVLQTPTHRIVDATKILAVYARSGKATYEGGMTVTFDFVGLRSGMVVMMGEEVLPPAIRRRFTDIWGDIDGDWKLLVRQATNIPAA